MLGPAAVFRLDIATPTDSIRDRMDPAWVFRREPEKCFGATRLSPW